MFKKTFPVFGVSLYQVQTIPEVVQGCLLRLESSEPTLEDVFAENIDVNSFVSVVEQGQKVDFAKISLASCVVFLRKYLEELPEAIVTKEVYWKILRAFDSFDKVCPAANPDSFEKLLYVRSMLVNLPVINYQILSRILGILANAAQKCSSTNVIDDNGKENILIRQSTTVKSKGNEMTSQSIESIISRISKEFAPLFFRLNKQDGYKKRFPLSAPRPLDLTTSIEAVSYWLAFYNELFMLNPYKELIAVAQAEHETQQNNIFLRQQIETLNVRHAKLFANMLQKRFVEGVLTRCFLSWRTETLKGKIERTGTGAKHDYLSEAFKADIKDLRRLSTGTTPRPGTTPKPIGNVSFADLHVAPAMSFVQEPSRRSLFSPNH